MALENLIVNDTPITSIHIEAVSHELSVGNIFRVSLTALVGVFGLITNVMNVAVFLKQGVRDCVSVCLISVSFSDFAAVVSGLLTLFCSLSMSIVPHIDLEAMYYLLYRTCAMLYNISTFTTTFVSLERCLCVALPFKFKSLMTLGKSIFVVVILYFCGLVLSLPFYIVTENVGSQHNTSTNGSKLFTWTTPERVISALFAITAIQFAAEPLCLLVILISTYIMIFCLKRSSQLRAKHTRPNTEIAQEKYLSFPKATSNLTSQSNSHIRVSKTVASLALVTSMSITLRFIIIIVILICPDINSGAKHEELFYLLLDIVFFFQTVSVSAHVFVFNVFNVAFRRTFQEMFCKIYLRETNT